MIGVAIIYLGMLGFIVALVMLAFSIFRDRSQILKWVLVVIASILLTFIGAAIAGPPPETAKTSSIINNIILNNV